MVEATEQDQEAGRAVVREVLINRLKEAGLKRARGQTEAALARMLDHLAEWLAYMHRDNLATLAEVALSHALPPGPVSGQWPSEIMIRQWASALQPKPFSQHPIVANWLRSREGPVALAGGYLVPLLRWLRRNKRGLTVADVAAVRREADDMQGRLTRIRERIEAGAPWPDDRDMLETWLRDEAQALQYVDLGIEHRAKLAEQGEQAA